MSLTCVGLHNTTNRSVFASPEPTRKPSHDDAGGYLNNCLGKLASSTAAKPGVVRRVQNQPSDRVGNDRPNSDAEQLPIALSYHGFGHFLDVTDGASTNHILNIDLPQILL